MCYHLAKFHYLSHSFATLSSFLFFITIDFVNNTKYHLFTSSFDSKAVPVRVLAALIRMPFPNYPFYFLSFFRSLCENPSDAEWKTAEEEEDNN